MLRGFLMLAAFFGFTGVALGAFAAGLILSASRHSHDIDAAVKPLVALFATVFFVLIGTACDIGKVKGCQGTMMQVRYDDDESVTLEGVNKANMEEAAIGTWWDKEDKTVGFTRYVVMDDGVTWLNLRQNLRVLLDVQASTLKYVFPESEKK